MALPGVDEDGGEEQERDQRQQDGQHEHRSWHVGGLLWISAAGVRLGGARGFLHEALVLTPGVGLAAGGGRGGVLEVSSFTGDTVAVSLRDFIFELSLSARRAVGEWLTVLTLRVPKDAVHPRLAVTLGLAVASARHELHEAQHLVTGAAQLAEGEMVPVLIVRLLGARGTDSVLEAATFGGDVRARGASRAAEAKLGLVVLLFLVSAALVLCVVWEPLHGPLPLQLGLGRGQETPDAQDE